MTKMPGRWKLKVNPGVGINSSCWSVRVKVMNEELKNLTRVMDTSFATTMELSKSRALNHTKRPILLVDDVPARVDILTQLLTEEGYLVLPAANCRDALDIVNAIKLDLVLLNLTTPLEEEWGTFRRLAAHNSVLPVLLITDHPEQFFYAMASGISAFLEMPFNFTKISERVRSLMENGQKCGWHVSMSTF
jgi:CheY-like chemotaxis protein